MFARQHARNHPQHGLKTKRMDMQWALAVYTVRKMGWDRRGSTRKWLRFTNSWSEQSNHPIFAFTVMSSGLLRVKIVILYDCMKVWPIYSVLIGLVFEIIRLQKKNSRSLNGDGFSSVAHYIVFHTICLPICKHAFCIKYRYRHFRRVLFMQYIWHSHHLWMCTVFGAACAWLCANIL